MIRQISMSDQPGRGPTWSRIVGTLLMLPIGIIIVFVLFYFAAFRGRYFAAGDFLIVFVVIFLGLFGVRWLFWRSRRRYWREHWRENGSVRIIRERYARGEITKEQFDQMLLDLKQDR